MKMTDASTSGAVEARAYSYLPSRLSLQLCTFGLAACLVIAVSFSGGSSGSTISRILLSAVGGWGLCYVIRRLLSPRRFVIDNGVIRGDYLRGRGRSWKLECLRVERKGFANLWEASTTVGLTSGEMAFRVYRDLPGYKDLCAVLAGKQSRDP